MSALDSSQRRWPTRRAAALGAHAQRAWHRFSEVNGNRMAGAISFFGFLAIFPLLVLAFAVLGYLVADGSAVVTSLTDELAANFPGLVGRGAASAISIDRISAVRGSAAVIGLSGFFVAGLGWVDATRTSIRTMFGREPHPYPFWIRKPADAASLAVMGVLLGLSSTIAIGLSAAAGAVLGWVGVQTSGLGVALLWIVGSALSVVVDVAVFAYFMVGMGRLRRQVPVRGVLAGSILGAVGFEVLKRVGTLYVEHTTANPVYGTVAVAVGLLVWINAVSRLLLLCTAWAATVEPPAGPDPERGGST